MTGEEHRKKKGIPNDLWQNYILILEEQTSDWEKLQDKEPKSASIGTLTWDDVAILEVEGETLRYYPSNSKYDLKKDFKFIIDEFVKRVLK